MLLQFFSNYLIFSVNILEVNLILAQIPVYYRFPKDGEHLPKHVVKIKNIDNL